jgi:hypothetical protein
MAGLHLGKRTLLDTPRPGGDSSTMRTAPRAGLVSAALAIFLAQPSPGQSAVAADLWRVASGTLVVPAALADDASGALWTPAFALPADGPSARLGVEAIHAPADAGVGGSVAAASFRPRAGWTLSAVWGRLSIGDLVRTETSPEAIGDIAAYAQVFSLGAARSLAGGAVTVGVAARALDGRLDELGSTRLTADAGVLIAAGHLRLGAATHFFDPTSASAASGAGYSLGAALHTSEGTLWGVSVRAEVRYGLGMAHGEGASHLLSAGVRLARALELDAGAARESTAGTAAWRGRFGGAVSAGRYRVYVGRDGGVNGFGATYRFGLVATLR